MPDHALVKDLADLFERDILKLKNEIIAYADDQQLWIVKSQINNSGGNLCLHLMGNLQHYIGKLLGGSDYTRDRPAEFSRKHVVKEDILDELERTLRVVKPAILALSEEQLAKNYPEKVYEFDMSVRYFLLHLLAHLNYHLGQINYHRRLI
jgi:uncharacterized damage-inducible protein DinB